MIQLQKISALTLLLILISCKNPEKKSLIKKRITFESFPERQYLSGEKFTYDSIIFPRKILVKDNFLIVSNSGNEKPIHIIDRTTMEYEEGKGVIGDGPGEIATGVWEIDSGLQSDSFWVYDLMGKSFYEFTLHKNSLLAKRTIRQNERWFLGFSMNWKSPNEVISYLSRSTHAFGIFDTLGNQKKLIRPWALDKPVTELLGYQLADLYQGPIAYNSKNRILGHAARKFEYFQLIDLQKETTTEILGPSNSTNFPDSNHDEATIHSILESDPIQGYTDVFVGDDSIFLLYIGKTATQERLSGTSSNMIFAFDLEGNPKSIFETDFPIRSFTITEEERSIYAVTSDENPGIVKFLY